MQKTILTLVCILSSFLIQAQDSNKFSVTVQITGMKSDKGNVYVALYNAEKDFLKKPFKGDIVVVKNKKATAVFKNIKNGVYAISVFHDTNENKKMDTNFLGIPKEPTGMSNNAKAFMGPPKFKDAKFIVDKNRILSIKVK
ncbi:MAG: DUF2141 domain-containing protein [Flavobacteriaceae bacterium]|nr:DUF2141 domain-containing protein [Flavobacteriaceae bacterium]